MNITNLKNRLKKLEPKQKADHFFGELYTNDPHYACKFSDNFIGGKVVAGTWRIFGKIYGSGLACCFENGFYSSLEDGMEQITKAFRKHTFEPCSIYHVETIDGKFELHTVYALEGAKIIDKYPNGGVEEVVPEQEGDDLTKLSDIELVAFFNTVF